MVGKNENKKTSIVGAESRSAWVVYSTCLCVMKLMGNLNSVHHPANTTILKNYLVKTNAAQQNYFQMFFESEQNWY